MEKTDEDLYYNTEWDYTCEESELEPEDKNDPDVHIGSKNPIMGILEENKTFISSRPGCILYRLDEMESWAYLDDLLP